MNDPQLEGHMPSHIERRKFLATLLGGLACSLSAQCRCEGLAGSLNECIRNHLARFRGRRIDSAVSMSTFIRADRRSSAMSPTPGGVQDKNEGQAHATEDKRAIDSFVN